MPAPSAVRPPQQERSRATLYRFLEATMALLGERRFEEATVAEIARRARSSVGAFYARFADKDALMDHLDSQLFESGKAAWDEFLASDRWRGKTAAEVVTAVVERVARKRREHRGLLRALALYARSQPSARFLEHARQLNRHVYERVRALLLERRREIGHSDPERAIEVGLMFVDAATREAVLFDDLGALPRRLSHAALTRELAAAWLSYLGAPRTLRPRKGREPKTRVLRGAERTALTIDTNVGIERPGSRRT
jgi:AcrR family transcriptional regulator